jgi:hypothetical protein
VDYHIVRAGLFWVEFGHLAPFDLCRGIKKMMKRATIRRVSGRTVAIAVLIGGMFSVPSTSLADEGGVSFWLPGIYGSLAAVPQQPGFSFASIYYHGSVRASGAAAASREVTIGGLPANVNVNLNVNLKAKLDLALLVPTYTFANPVLDGQLSIGMMMITGRNNTSLDGTLTLAPCPAPPGPGPCSFAGSRDSTLTGFGDLFPQATLRWNQGVHNFMTYVTGNIPVGAYNSNRLANLGLGHGAIDGGVGYTYFNPQSGREFSAVTGFTYNFENPDTNYRNGIDWHLDWGLSQFLSKQLHVGAVGYWYNQLTADSGAAAFLGDNISRVMGIGPQIGYIFPVGDKQGYLNLKGYYEFNADRRADGWNLWLTFAISPAAQASAAAQRTALIHK